MIYRFMAQHKGAFDVQVVCQALGVSRNGYYARQKGGQTSQHEQADAALMAQIRQIIEDSHQTYGSLRIYAELSHRDAGGKISKHGV
jgi:putative transposase